MEKDDFFEDLDNTSNIGDVIKESEEQLRQTRELREREKKMIREERRRRMIEETKREKKTEGEEAEPLPPVRG